MHSISNLLESYILLAIGIFIAYPISITFWNLFAHKFFRQDRFEIQNIHQSNVDIPRFGGLMIILTLVSFNITHQPPIELSLINNLIIFSLPMILVAISEDFFYNISPFMRLLFSFLSIILFFIYFDFSYPVIEIPFMHDILNNSEMKYVLFTLSLVALINGMNVIDGANGLAPMTALASLIALGYLAYLNSDYEITLTTLIIAFSIIVMLIFNYPWGKIFLGDTGAYFLGWCIGLLVIIFYGRNDQLPTWSACLLIFYPSIEIIFSFCRKLCSGNSPFRPDNNHLHLRIYFILEKKINNKLLANNLLMPLLFIIWMLPPIVCVFIFNDLYLIIISLISFTALYFLIYGLTFINSSKDIIKK